MTARYYADSLPLNPGDEVVLSGDESRHLLKTMRTRVGESVEVFGPSGLWSAKLVRSDGPSAVLEIYQSLQAPARPSVHVSFIIPWIKGGKTDFLVQKLTELGAAQIIVFHARREVARGDDSKIDRLGRIALEACKQCERIDIPEIRLAGSVSSAFDSIYDTPVSHRFLLHEREKAVPLSTAYSAFAGKPGRIAVASGPEGGWHPDEISECGGVTLVSLGPRILRAETAPLVAASALLTLAGDI